MCSTLLDTRNARPLAQAAELASACIKKSCYGSQSCPAVSALATEASPAAIEAKANAAQLPIAIADELVADILKPYRAHSRYLKSAAIAGFRDKADPASKATDPMVRATGRFAIEESCYIDDTGHFNAVEFNICFNQLAYVMFGKCVEAGILHRLRQEKVNVLSLSEFKRHQLPSMVIVSIESRYYKQLDSRDFQGELTLDKVSSVGDAWFFFTTMTFSDREGVTAKGSVVLAFSPNFTPVKH